MTKNKLKYRSQDWDDDQKHWDDFGVKTGEEYLKKCYSVIKNSNEVFVNDYYGEFQFVFKRNSDGLAVALTADGIRTVGKKGQRGFEGLTGDNGRRIK